jgi:hypothetical protein
VRVVDEQQVEPAFDLRKPALGCGRMEAEHATILVALERQPSGV